MSQMSRSLVAAVLAVGVLGFPCSVQAGDYDDYDYGDDYYSGDGYDVPYPGPYLLSQFVEHQSPRRLSMGPRFMDGCLYPLRLPQAAVSIVTGVGIAV